ncbi:UNVERIFIED_CONTAM: hypothetical protein FKN15_004050 [Acipenser sinensis]
MAAALESCGFRMIKTWRYCLHTRCTAVFCGSVRQTRVYLGMTTLRDLIFKRPSRQFQYLHVLLDLSSHEKDKVRTHALTFIKRMYEKDQLRDYIEKFALNYMQLLVHPNPPSMLFGADQDTEVAAPWSEDTVKQCLYLYLTLLPLSHKLIHELASVYTEAIADIKRTVLRVIEQPIRGMGMSSPELLLLVENCPKGAETLVTRCLHILTDKVPPSQELVRRVRDLYHKRVPDVRFLIPVLNGLEKKEVIQALPKLIKLNPIVVKEVFNRLLGTQHSEGSSTVSPLTPGELLISLHNIDSTRCDMKSIIKATNLCFAEKNVYTSEVLAVVMQHLMEQSPLPMLLMRTVIQSLTMYPRLGGFVMNILSRLIIKQVWKYPKVWEGFIKCCQRTKPQSFAVLLQLPPPQLSSVFDKCPELRDPLLVHVRSFTPHQVWKYPKVWEGFIKCCQRTKPQSFAVLLQLPPPQLSSVFDKCPELRDPLLVHVRSFTPHQVWKYPKVWEGFIKCCQRTKPQSFAVLLQLPPPQLSSVFDKCPELRDPLLVHVRSFTPHQVWKYPKVWEGFIKCCQRTKPQSFAVLLQLPPPQLSSVFDKCPELRDPLLVHVRSFTPHQQAHVPRSIMTVLEANLKADPEPPEPKENDEPEPRGGGGAPRATLPDVMAARLEQEKELKRQLEEEHQRVKGHPAEPGATELEEAMELREEGAAKEDCALILDSSQEDPALGIKDNQTEAISGETLEDGDKLVLDQVEPMEEPLADSSPTTSQSQEAMEQGEGGDLTEDL